MPEKNGETGSDQTGLLEAEELLVKGGNVAAREGWLEQLCDRFTRNLKNAPSSAPELQGDRFQQTVTSIKIELQVLKEKFGL